MPKDPYSRTPSPNIRSFLFLLREALADAGINTRVGWVIAHWHGCHQREPLLAEGLVICIYIVPSFRGPTTSEANGSDYLTFSHFISLFNFAQTYQ